MKNKPAELLPRTMDEFAQTVNELFPRYHPRFVMGEKHLLILFRVWGDSDRWPEFEIEVNKELAFDPHFDLSGYVAAQFDQSVAKLMWLHYPRIRWGDNPPPSPYA